MDITKPAAVTKGRAVAAITAKLRLLKNVRAIILGCLCCFADRL
jgi:hypothetical protein